MERTVLSLKACLHSLSLVSGLAKYYLRYSRERSSDFSVAQFTDVPGLPNQATVLCNVTVWSTHSYAHIEWKS